MTSQHPHLAIQDAAGLAPGRKRCSENFNLLAAKLIEEDLRHGTDAVAE
jgi:hypothetical protein